MNQIKTFILMAVLTILLVWVGSLVGGRNGAVLALVFAGVMNFGIYWFSDRIVLKMYRAKPVTEAEQPALYRIMRLLNEDELKGVLAHELSHVRHRDILIGTIAATIAGAISMIASFARWGAIFGGDDREGGAAQLVIMLVLTTLAAFAAFLIQLAISRSREYHADEGGAQLSGNPLYLARALGKLDAGTKRIPMQVNPSTAHMFIVNPLKAKGIQGLFSTHPPIEKRIARLEAMSHR
jgi:heat shock protein HtpX